MYSLVSFCHNYALSDSEKQKKKKRSEGDRIYNPEKRPISIEKVLIFILCYKRKIISGQKFFCLHISFFDSIHSLTDYIPNLMLFIFEKKILVCLLRVSSRLSAPALPSITFNFSSLSSMFVALNTGKTKSEPEKRAKSVVYSIQKYFIIQKHSVNFFLYYTQ